jgi:very-short-patch-repair endonuclease
MSAGEETFALHCKAYGLQPERELAFHPKRKWRFDFAFPGYRLAVEIEGGTWARGRHSRGSGYLKDCEKYNTAAMMGWKVLRYPTQLVMDGTAIEQVREALK